MSSYRWERQILGAIGVVCALVTLLLAWRYPHGQATDGYSYVDIADLIAEGRLRDAVNGYWSVLLPVVLAPFRFFGASGIVAYSGVSVVAVSGIVWFLYRIGKTLNVNLVALFILCLFVGLRAALLAIEVWTPDVLFAAYGLGITYLALKMRPEFTVPGWALFGLLCGGLYYAKPVGLYTALALCGLVWIVQFGAGLKSGHRPALVRLLAMMLGYALAVVPWFVALRIKYGYLTTGYSGKHNLAVSALEPGEQIPFPFELWHRPFEGATSYSNDYTFVGFQLPYSILSREGIALIIENLRQNTVALWAEQPYMVFFSLLSVFGLLVLLDRNHSVPKPLLVVLGAGLIQVLIYLPILIEHRYLLLSMALIAIAAVAITEHLVTTNGWKAAVSISLAMVAVVMMVTFHMRNGAVLEPPLEYIHTREVGGERRAVIANGLEIDVSSCSKIASHWGNRGLNRNEAMEIAHTFNWFNAGAIPHNLTDEEVIAALDTYNIDCVLVWNGTEVPALLESRLTYLTTDSDYGVVEIYRYQPSSP